MAKKIKEKKTVEELLDEALVPESEKPYKIPGNWVWCNLSSIMLELETGSRPKGGVKDIKSGVPSLGGEHLSYDGKFNFSSIRYIPEDFAKKMNRGRIQENDILIVKDGATTGKTSFVDKTFPYDLAFVNEHVFIFRNSRKVSSKFIFNFLISKIGQTFILKNFKGSAQGGINSTFVNNVFTPLPPLQEQQRIVEKLESMLGKIKQAKELIQESKDTFKTRRASILAKAFSGELTKNWREKNENNIEENISSQEDGLYPIPDSWKWSTFSDVASVASKLVKPDNYKDLPLIAPDNIEKESGRLLEFKTVLESNVISDKHYFYSGQILYSKIRPYLAKVVKVDFDGLCSADMYPIECKINRDYLFQYMLSSFFTKLASTAGSRSVLPKINQKELSLIPIPLPPLEEQEEIVRIVEKLLKTEDEALEYVESMEEHLETLEKSILSKAFRGELGTNNPDEESSLNLLKEILSEN